MIFEEDAKSTVAFFGDSLLDQIVDRRGKLIVVETFAESHVERHVQAAINLVDRFEAGGEELVPQAKVFFVAGVQLRRLSKHVLADVRILPCLVREFFIRLDRCQLRFERLNLVTHSGDARLALSQRFRLLLCGVRIRRRLRAFCG